MFSISSETKFLKDMAVPCAHISSVFSEWNLYAQGILCQRSLRLQLKSSVAKFEILETFTTFRPVQ